MECLGTPLDEVENQAGWHKGSSFQGTLTVPASQCIETKDELGGGGVASGRVLSHCEPGCEN